MEFLGHAVEMQFALTTIWISAICQSKVDVVARDYISVVSVGVSSRITHTRTAQCVKRLPDLALQVLQMMTNSMTSFARLLKQKLQNIALSYQRLSLSVSQHQNLDRCRSHWSLKFVQEQPCLAGASKKLVLMSWQLITPTIVFTLWHIFATWI